MLQWKTHDSKKLRLCKFMILHFCLCVLKSNNTDGYDDDGSNNKDRTSGSSSNIISPPLRPFDHISADNLGHAEHSYFHASGFILELDYLSYSLVQLIMS